MIKLDSISRLFSNTFEKYQLELNDFNWVVRCTSLKCLCVWCFQDSKPKGVAHLIDIENPNHVVRKTKKVSELDGSQSQPTLTRRQRYCVCCACPYQL